MGLRRRVSVLLLLLLLLQTVLPAFAQSTSLGNQAVNADDLGTLIQGQVSEKALAGGQAHLYHIALQASQFLHIEVNQKGIDVVAVLYSPSGQKLVEIDGPTGNQGKEIVYYISETAGDYRLEIRSLESDAPQGRYEAKIVELRAASEKDKFRISAEKLYAEAEALVSQGTAASIQQAIEKYQASLVQWRLYGDKKEIAATLNSLGLALGFFDGSKALEAYTEASRLFEEIGEKRRYSRVQHNIGLLYKVSEPRKALGYFKTALETFRAIDDRLAQPVALNNVGECYMYLSEYQAALDAFEPALALFREQNNVRDVALVLASMGVIYGIFNDTEREKDYYEQSLALRTSINDRRGQSNALNNLAFVYFKQGDMTKALEFYEQALAIRRALGVKREEAITLRNMGTVYRSLGQTQKALEAYQTSLTILQASNDLIWSGRTLGSTGIVYMDMGDNARAREAFQKALTLSQTTGSRTDEVQMLYYLALIDRNEGNFAEAENKIKTALTHAESLRSTLFNAERRSGYFASVQKFFELYVDVLMQQNKQQPNAKFDVAAFQVNERSRARSLLELLNESQANIRQGVTPDLLEKERSLQEKYNLKTSALTRLFTTKNTEAQAVTLRREIDELKREYERVQAEIRANSPRYAALTQPQPLTLAEIQQQVLDDDTLLLEYSLGEKRSYLWLIGKKSFQTFELPERAKIETQAQRFYELLTARNKRVKFETVDEKNVRVEEADKDFPAVAAALSQIVLAPVAKQLGNKRLLIVADGALQYVPFAALPKPFIETSANKQNDAEKINPQMAVNHEIVTLPSVSTLALLRRELKNRQPAPKALAVLADPVFDEEDERLKAMLAKNSAQPKSNVVAVSRKSKSNLDIKRAVDDMDSDSDDFSLPRLIFTRQEANAIAGLTPSNQRKAMLDFAASRNAAFDANLSQYRIVHFATHSFINNQHPDLSGIALSLFDENGKEQDGFLRMGDVYNLKLPADLVVLSGCRTGLGKEIRGEGLVGLTRGFMYAGAARVAVSLWDVNDEATSELMTRFYRAMLKDKLSSAAALRQAQVSMMKDKRWSNPYYWAAFILQGEPK